jgi:hypothetical protein
MTAIEYKQFKEQFNLAKGIIWRYLDKSLGNRQRAWKYGCLGYYQLESNPATPYHLAQYKQWIERFITND